MATQSVASFSGGEKARLVLAMLAWQKPNLLLLDEPTNHLDLEMREALMLALQTYSGALILVSHDRHLLRLVTDELFLVHDKKVDRFEGDLDDYKDWLIATIADEGRTPQAQKKKRAKQLEKELAKLYKEIEKLKNDPNTKSRDINRLEKEIANLEQEWMELGH